jgi:phage terminase large subunit-like protein
MPSRRVEFRTKHLCEWILNGGDGPFLDPIAVRACYDEKLDEKEFLSAHCSCGMDLASRKDLSTVVKVFMRRDGKKPHYYAFTKAWIPEKTMKESSNSQYRGWEQAGHLLVTPGSRTDLDVVETAVIEDSKLFKIRDVLYDPFQANMLAGHLEKAGIICPEIPQFAKYMTVGMRFLDDIVAGGQLHFNSPLLRWCLLNLQARYGGTSMVWPVRPKNLELKIDAAVALLFALHSVAMSPLDEYLENPYEHHGIRFLEDLLPEEKAKLKEW